MKDGKRFVGINRLFDAMPNNGREFTLSWCRVKEGSLIIAVFVATGRF